MYIPPPPHIRETERLEELYRLGVLDTAPESRFDRITKLVSQTLDFPVVLVSLTDVNRQWFKSTCNFGVTEAPRDVAFCAYAINQEDGALLIPDMLDDDRFRENPLVIGDPHVRSYAGIVLRSPKMLPLGTLCVIDFKPRKLDTPTVDILRGFAEIVRDELLKRTKFAVKGLNDDGDVFDAIEVAIPSNEFTYTAQKACEAEPESRNAMVVIDAPKLGQIRRAYGRETTDQFKAELARRVRIALNNRRFLIGLDDEHLFSILVNLDGNADAPETIASDLRFAIGMRIQTQSMTVSTPIRIGIAAMDRTNTDLDKAVHNAQIACQSISSRDNGARSSIYNEAMGQRVQRAVAIRQKLQGALSNDRIKIFFQPKVDIVRNRIHGAEALIRWHDDELGTISPPEIITAASEMDITIALDEWVLHRVCRHLADWKKNGVGMLPVSVNLSGETLNKPDLALWTRVILKTHGVPASSIDFEILESAVVNDIERTIETINKCREIGITFSLDDFGTGQSSLSYLQRLPVDTLKIDKSFIDEIVHNTERGAMVRQIIAMGHTLNRKIVAEGAETVGQYLILRSFGCNFIQGYFFSKPLPEVEFLALRAQNDGELMPRGLTNI